MSSSLSPYYFPPGTQGRIDQLSSSLSPYFPPGTQYSMDKNGYFEAFRYNEAGKKVILNELEVEEKKPNKEDFKNTVDKINKKVLKYLHKMGYDNVILHKKITENPKLLERINKIDQLTWKYLYNIGRDLNNEEEDDDDDLLDMEEGEKEGESELEEVNKYIIDNKDYVPKISYKAIDDLYVLANNLEEERCDEHSCILDSDFIYSKWPLGFTGRLENVALLGLKKLCLPFSKTGVMIIDRKRVRVILSNALDHLKKNDMEDWAKEGAKHWVESEQSQQTKSLDQLKDKDQELEPVESKQSKIYNYRIEYLFDIKEKSKSGMYDEKDDNYLLAQPLGPTGRLKSLTYGFIGKVVPSGNLKRYVLRKRMESNVESLINKNSKLEVLLETKIREKRAQNKKEA